MRGEKEGGRGEGGRERVEYITYVEVRQSDMRILTC